MAEVVVYLLKKFIYWLLINSALVAAVIVAAELAIEVCLIY